MDKYKVITNNSNYVVSYVISTSPPDWDLEYLNRLIFVAQDVHKLRAWRRTAWARHFTTINARTENSIPPTLHDTKSLPPSQRITTSSWLSKDFPTKNPACQAFSFECQCSKHRRLGPPCNNLYELLHTFQGHTVTCLPLHTSSTATSN
jgi:hypothetical protein